MAKTISSRLKRFEEKRLRTRLLLAIFGTITLLVLLGFFGLRMFIAFTVFLGQMQGQDAIATPTPRALVIPPYVDPLPMATSSGSVIITGRGQASATLVL